MKIEICMPDNDKKIFNSYLKKAINFVEFGCGGSTLLACNTNNIKKIISTESDKKWVNILKNNLIIKNNIEKKRLNINLIDLDCEKTKWGNPGKNSDKKDWIKYSNAPDIKDIDLVLIDGRFRVACALKIFEKISDNSILIVDDFVRSYYSFILKYYDIIEKGERLCVFKKKKNIKMNQGDITKYELITK